MWIHWCLLLLSIVVLVYEPMTYQKFQYLASEIFTTLPVALRTLTYSIWINTPSLHPTYALPLTLPTTTNLLNALPSSIPETLETYALLSPSQTVPEFLTPVINAYLSSLTTAPLPPSQTKDAAEGCEICEREWIPLTYHHLIPRGVHAKVIKRGWHSEDQLENVACELFREIAPGPLVWSLTLVM